MQVARAIDATDVSWCAHPEPERPMQSFVYASRRKPDTYVWLRRRDDFDPLPAPLREQLGELRFVLEIDLGAERQLPHENAVTILANLDGQGWHLQLPPGDTDAAASI